MTRPRTARIKPATRHAVLDQLAAIADGIIRERINGESLLVQLGAVPLGGGYFVMPAPQQPRRWWQVWK